MIKGNDVGVRDELILKAQKSDPHALNELIIYSKKDVRKYALKHCRSEDVEDAVQESLYALSKGIYGLKSLSAFTSWLFIIVKRECHRALRAAYQFAQFKNSNEYDYITSTSDLDLRMDLVKMLHSLPPHYLTVIILRDFEELSVKEIALKLNEDVPAIKSRIFRAREMIREYMNSQNRRVT